MANEPTRFTLLQIGKPGDPGAGIALSEPGAIDALDEKSRAAKSAPDAQGTVAFGEVTVGGRDYTVANTFDNVAVSIWPGPVGPEEPATTFETRVLAFESPENPGEFHNFLMVPETELETAKAGMSGGGTEAFGTTSMMAAGTGGEDGGFFTNIVFTGDGSDELIDGTEFADTLDGAGGNDTINGLDGNDSLIGGLGNDDIFGGDGNDTIRGGAGDDNIDGGPGFDIIEGNAGNDSIIGGGGIDRMSVVVNNFGNDTFVAGEDGSRDEINMSVTTLGVEIDFSQGTAGDPESGLITSGANTIEFSEVEAFALSQGDDIVIGSTGNDIVQTMFDGNDSVDGFAGDDAFAGGFGDDTLNGGIGADTLIADEGFDLIDVGVDGDRDVVFVGDGDQDDTITSFDVSQFGDGSSEDQLDVAGLTDLGGNPINAFDDVIVTDDGGGNAVLTFPNGDTITLIGVAPSEVDKANELNDIGIVCFTPGILITTSEGNVPVEDLQVGDRVLTVDSGFQEIRWVGRRTLNRADLDANPNLRPIIVRKAAFGNARKMRVSPQHGLYLKSDEGGRLIRAKHAAEHMGGKFARVDRHCDEVTYIHIMFDAHQLIFAEGAPSEAFYPGPVAMQSLSRDCMLELLTIFPELGETVVLGKPAMAYGCSARPYLRGRDARLLLRAPASGGQPPSMQNSTADN